MNLYLKSGYLDMAKIIELKTPFIFVTGGRGTGKSYGALKYLIDKNQKFILMRRTQTQIDMIKNDSFNPFKALGDGYNLMVKSINKNMGAVYNAEFDSEKQMNQPSGAPLGYFCALSTISNIRGFDASDIDIIIYDEFIGEKHERPIKEEGASFLNAYETINRNRELNGKEPVKMVCLANSNDLANPIFMQLKLVSVAEKMRNKGLEFYQDYKKGFTLIILNQSPIGKAKEQTALYNLAGDSEFTNMSLKNEFANEEMGLIKALSLKDFKPIVKVGDMTIYKHKNKKQYYCSGHSSGTPPTYDTSVMDLKRFRRNYYMLWLHYLNNNIVFESYTFQIMFERCYELK